MERLERGLRVGILENKSIGNCSNNGISSQVASLILIPNDVCPEVPEISEGEKPILVEIEKRVIGGKDYFTAVPCDLKDSGKWYMFGGTYITTSDSRFPFNHPIPLHDRVEY